MGRAVRILLLAALAAGACRWAPPPEPVVLPGDGPVPIRDRYAGQRRVLLDAINADRTARGLAPVALDSVATVVAQVHARAMADGGFLSHYALDGSAPYVRVSRAGLTAHVRENVFRWTLRPDGPEDPVRPWLRFDVRRAEKWLMASPPHRATILDPARTHVGLGIAEDRAGSVYVVQEFIARHARLEVPPRAWRRAPVVVRGRMTVSEARPLLVFLSRETATVPWPGGRPPGGPYTDGGSDGFLVPPWRIRWNVTDRSFSLELEPGALRESSRWYGIVYVAPEELVRTAIGRRSVESGAGYPGAAFVIEIL